MNKKVRVSLIILSAVLLSACTAKAPLAPNSDVEQGSPTSMRELLGMGKNQKCTFSISRTLEEDGQATKTEGTFYVSGNKFAEEIKITSDMEGFENINMFMVSDGVDLYTWNKDKSVTGMKYRMDDSAEPTDPNSDSRNVDLDEKVDMKCSPWIVDKKVFEVPTDVVFTDLSDMMKNMPTMPANLQVGE
jgi:hypothetical protein